MRAAGTAFVVLAALVGGCTVTYPEGVISCSDGVPCPTGWFCRAALCYSTALPDAGPDAALDAGPDAGPDAGRDAGPDSSVEECATCPWHFGRPHAVPSLHPADTYVFGAALPADGLTIYVVAGNGATSDFGIFEAHRERTADPFGPQTETRALAGVAPILVSTTGDGLELFAQISDERAGPPRTHVVVYTRPDLATPFGAPVDLPELDIAAEVAHPTVTADGLDLFVTGISADGSVRQIYELQRLSRTEMFRDARLADEFLGGASFPRVTPNGLGIFVGNPARYATRLDRASRFEPLARIGPEAAPPGCFLPTYVPATRELWFATQDIPWSPSQYSLWRVQVCRDGPCAPEPTVMDCPPGSALSADQFHCYYAREASESWDSAQTKCVEGAANLASVHSAAELALIAGLTPPLMPGAGRWLGATDLGTPGSFRWTTGEPFIYAPWVSGEPNPTQDCLTVRDGAFHVDNCSVPANSVCERSVWPTW